MKKILFAALALTLVSGISYANEGGKKKGKKAKTECSKHCSGETSCCKKSKAA